jgi:catechol 2,3-dioxygenase-like lactoylglutathione lyase family enzyme
MTALISGIQQIGVGCASVHDTFAWYRKNLGMNVPLFDEAAEAGLMLPYTQGEVRSRHAIMALSMAGGGGAEIWQYTSRKPVACSFEPQLGDIGIFASKIKCMDLDATRRRLLANEGFATQIATKPDGSRAFWTRDNNGLAIQLIEGTQWFRTSGKTNGGVCGAVIGVTDIDAAMGFYAGVIGIDQVVFDKTGFFEDLNIEENGKKYRRVVLRKVASTTAPFGKLLGNVEIELIQAIDYSPKNIFAGRDWGDLGYIHLCFDTSDMYRLEQKCKAAGHLFTVDSASSFDMGEAAGRFSYVEDPDGTLIEFVEAHKVPILKKLGIYLHLKNRKKQKNLPDWMVGTLGWGAVKD